MYKHIYLYNERMLTYYKMYSYKILVIISFIYSFYGTNIMYIYICSILKFFNLSENVKFVTTSAIYVFNFSIKLLTINMLIKSTYII